MKIYCNYFFQDHFGPKNTTENADRIKIVVDNIPNIIFIKDIDDYLPKYNLSKMIKNCDECTFENQGSKCEICGNNLKNYFNYVSSIDGDTTYIGSKTNICLANVLPTIRQAINNFLSTLENSFLLIRPPGHHCGDRINDENKTANGFCLINNIIYGIDYLKTIRKDVKIVVIDWDAHRGNGTQKLLGKNDFMFDIHEKNIFPYDEYVKNENIKNYLISSETTKKEVFDIFDEIIEKTNLIKPDFIFISCGFDAHKDDHMSNLQFDKTYYRYFRERLDTLKIPSLYFLEGGYIPKNILECIQEII